MNFNNALWLVCFLITLILALIALVFLSLREFRKVMSEKKEVELAQVALISQLTNLLSSRDPLVFQTLQENSLAPLMTSEPEIVEEESIDSLLARAEMFDDLTEAEIERINGAKFGLADPGPFIR